MRVYTPPKQKRSATWSLLFILAGMALYIASAFIPRFISIVQIASLAFIAAGIWILSRYVLVYYYYELDGENFRVIKVNGKKHTTMCNLSLRTATELKKLEKGEKKPRASVRYDYMRNFMADEKYIYIFEWNGQKAFITFEPNKEFFELMKYRIEEVKSTPLPEQEQKTNGWYEE